MSDRNGSVEGAEMVVQDIVTRLRHSLAVDPDIDADLTADAADEIERLRAERNHLFTELVHLKTDLAVLGPNAAIKRITGITDYGKEARREW